MLIFRTRFPSFLLHFPLSPSLPSWSSKEGKVEVAEDPRPVSGVEEGEEEEEEVVRKNFSLSLSI